MQQSKNSSWELGVRRLLYRDFVRVKHSSCKNPPPAQALFECERDQRCRSTTTAYQIGVNHDTLYRNRHGRRWFIIKKGIPILGAIPGLNDHNPAYATTRYENVELEFVLRDARLGALAPRRSTRVMQGSNIRRAYCIRQIIFDRRSDIR